MKVTVTKFGGFAAGIRLPRQIVDSSLLQESQVAELSRMIEPIDHDFQERASAPRSLRDGMSYTIVIETDGEPKVIHLSDDEMTPEIDALLQWVDRHKV